MKELLERLDSLAIELRDISEKIKGYQGIPVGLTTVDMVLERITSLVCYEYDITKDALCSDRKSDNIPTARVMIWKIAYLQGISDALIGDKVGKTASTMRSYRNTYNDKYLRDRLFQKTMKSIIQELKMI